jgi:transposase
MSILPVLLYVGLDCGTQNHYAYLLDPDAQSRGHRSFGHSPEAFDELVAWLLAHPQSEGDPSRVACAIESPRGALVETLLAHGFQVFAINPKQLDRFRDRHSPAGAKDDRRDAFVLADSLRTDGPLFHRVQPEPDELLALREHSRMRCALKSQEVRLQNQIRDRLRGYFPQMLELATDMDDPLLAALLKQWPTPEQAARCRVDKVRKILKEHRIRRVSAEEVHTLLRSARPCGAPARGEAEALCLLMELEQLALLHAQRATLDAAIAEDVQALARLQENESHHTDEPDDVAILRSLPGVGPVILGGLLAEGWQGFHDRDIEHLRTHGGIAPVTLQSGRLRLVRLRRACNGYLRDALHQWAQAALATDSRAHEHYLNCRARGHSHGRALRGVADMLLRLALGMLQSRTLYDADRWHTRRAPRQVA